MFPLSRTRRFFTSAGLLLLAILPAPAAHAQSSAYVFTKIIDNETARPDGLGNFYTGFPLAMPALDGNTVVFQDLASNDNSLWSANASGGSLVKLVDFRTPVPGGVGAFSRLNDQTGRARDGLYLFEGLDSVPTDPGHHLHGGIYTVPVGGGAVTKVVDYHTVAPEADGGPFVAANGNNMLTAGLNDGDFDYESGVIAFHGTTDFAGDGIYSVHVDGSGLVRLADRNTEGTARPFAVGQYYTAALHGGTAVFHGGTVFGPYGLFASPETGGLAHPALLAGPGAALPGSTASGNTSYATGFSRFDHVTGNYVFAANRPDVNGLYTVSFDNRADGFFTKVVDNRTALPGSTVPASYFDGTPFSADGGQVAFVTATNESAGQVGALYVANADGSITRVIGVNDTLDGIQIAGLTLGAHALSNGRIAFGAGSIFQGHDGLPRYGAIFVATPVSQTDDLAVRLSVSSDQPAVGQEVTFVVGVVNQGAAAAANPVLRFELPAGLTFLGSTGATSSSDHVVTLQRETLAATDSVSFQVTARVDAPGSLVATATAASGTVDANPANNTVQATLMAQDLPTVALAATTPVVTAGSGAKGVFTLTLSQPLDHPLLVNLRIKGSAHNGIDYVLLKSPKKIKAGRTKQTLKVAPLGAGAGPGGQQKVILVLQPGNGYKVGTAGKVKVRIVGQ